MSYLDPTGIPQQMGHSSLSWQSLPTKWGNGTTPSRWRHSLWAT